jgi:signal transduction histidine kinase
MDLSFYAVAAFINFITSILFGIFVLLKNVRNQKNIGFFIFAMFIGWWNLFYFIWQATSDSAEIALFWCRILMAFAIMIPAGYMHFTLAITDLIKKRKAPLFSTYAAFTAILLSDIIPYFFDSDFARKFYFIKRVAPIMSFKYWPMATTMVTIYTILIVIAFIYCDYLLIKKYLNSTGINRLQMKYVAIGCIVALTGGLFNLIPWYNIPIPPVTHVLVSVYVFLMGYAISRYRLMDMTFLFKNILLFLLAAASIYVLFYSVVFLYQGLFGDILSPAGYFLSAVLAVAFIVTIYISNEFLSNTINKYLFGSLYSHQKIIESSSKELSYYGDLNKTTEVIIKGAKDALNPKSMAILLADKDSSDEGFLKNVKSFGFQDGMGSVKYSLFQNYFQKKPGILIKDELNQFVQDSEEKNIDESIIFINDYVNENKISLCVPLMSDKNLSGIIIIGYSADGDSYNQEDLSFLEILSHQAQTSIDNAMLYQNIKKNNEDLKNLLNVRDDFIRVAHHQLNTPLSIMKNAYSMAEDGSLSHKKAMYYLANGLQRMDKTIKDFWKTFQSDEVGKKEELNIQKIDIVPLIKNIVKEKNSENLLSESKNKKVKISIEKSDFPIPFVLCDAEKIEYVIFNLLDNAVFYTNKGKVVVSYRLVKDGNYLQISIKDTGIGFSKEDKDKIAQKFFRAKEATLARPDGSGLGLYMCKSIMESNNGELTFDSEGAGKGSTFSFTLPISK